MNTSLWTSLKTPAFVYDLSIIKQAIDSARALYDGLGYHVLYSLKACTVRPLLESIGKQVDGFSVSSLFESRLAQEVIGARGSLHFVSAALTEHHIAPISEVVDYLTFNSLGQLGQFRNATYGSTKCGLRINPQLSFVPDDRLDPCRPHSKLGIPLNAAIEAFHEARVRQSVTGVLVHTNCDSCDLAQFRSTVQRVLPVLEAADGCLEWINMGGGYLFHRATNREAFADTVAMLRRTFGVSVFVEPGAAVVRDAGFLVASVVDIFRSDGKEVAILDTTASHTPEVFTIKSKLNVLSAHENGKHRYVLAGCSCFPGDVFGEYGFTQRLSLGSRIIFSEMGAYTLVKAQMFNGINLPSIFVTSNGEEPSLVREFTYDDFVSRHAASTRTSVKNTHSFHP